MGGTLVFLREEQGQDLVEYSMVVSVVALALIASVDQMALATHKLVLSMLVQINRLAGSISVWE